MYTQKVFLLFFFLIVQGVFVRGQIDISWARNFGGGRADYAQVVLPMPDGGCLIGGYTFSSDSDVLAPTQNGDSWLIRLSEQGIIQWRKTIGGAAFEQITALYRTGDGGILVLSNTRSADTYDHFGGYDCVLTKLNTNGGIIWESVLGGLGDDFGKSLAVNTSGGIYVAGDTFSDFETGNQSLQSDAFVAFFNSQGVRQWVQTYGGEGADFCQKILRNENGNLVLAGYSASSEGDLSDNRGLYDGWLFAINAQGNVLWSSNIGGSKNDVFLDAVLTDNQQIVTTGYTLSEDGAILQARGGKDAWLCRFSVTGELLWANTYGGTGSDVASGVTQIDDRFWVTGSTTSTDGTFPMRFSGTDLFIVEFSATGTLENQQILGGGRQDMCGAIASNIDAELFVVSSSNSTDGDIVSNKGAFDFWVLKAQTVSEEVPPDIVTLADTVMICEGNAVQIDLYEMCADCTFLWEDGSMDALRVLNPSTSTNYQLTLTEADGTTNVGSFMVDVLAPLNISLYQSPITCDDGSDGALSLEISGGDGDYNILWSTGATGVELQNLSSDIYRVTVEDGVGCEATEATILLNPLPLEINPLITNVACYGESTGSILLSVAGGNPPYDILWENGVQGAMLENIEAGFYSVEITDDNGCTVLRNYTVGASVPLGALPTLMPPSENGNDGMIDLLPFGGQPPYNIQWNTGAEGVPLTNLTNDTYQYTLTDGFGCTHTESIVLDVNNTEVPLVEYIKIYPNPSTGKIFMESKESSGDVEIYSLEGKKVFCTHIHSSNSPLDIRQLPPGVYFFHFIHQHKKAVQKIVIQ